MGIKRADHHEGEKGTNPAARGCHIEGELFPLFKSGCIVGGGDQRRSHPQRIHADQIEKPLRKLAHQPPQGEGDNIIEKVKGIGKEEKQVGEKKFLHHRPAQQPEQEPADHHLEGKKADDGDINFVTRPEKQQGHQNHRKSVETWLDRHFLQIFPAVNHQAQRD